MVDLTQFNIPQFEQAKPQPEQRPAINFFEPVHSQVQEPLPAAQPVPHVAPTLPDKFNDIDALVALQTVRITEKQDTIDDFDMDYPQRYNIYIHECKARNELIEESAAEWRIANQAAIDAKALASRLKLRTQLLRRLPGFKPPRKHDWEHN